MYLEIAFFISSIGIIIFLSYKLFVIKEEIEEEIEERRHTKYDPVEHVFSAGAIAFDGSLRVIKKASRGVRRIYTQIREKRNESKQKKRDDTTAKRGASSFYIKSISEYKKNIRKKMSKSFDNE